MRRPSRCSRWAGRTTSQNPSLTCCPSWVIVRSVGLPVTYSRGIATNSGWTLDYFTDHLGDFLDFHVYYLPGPTDSLQAFDLLGGANKKLIIGEFGISTTSSPDDRAAYYNAVRAMCANDPRCVWRARLVRLRPWPDKRHAVGFVL